MFQRPSCCRLDVIKELLHTFNCVYIKLWMYLGSLESTQEAIVARCVGECNSYASLVLFKLPGCIHNTIYTRKALNNCLIDRPRMKYVTTDFLLEILNQISTRGKFELNLIYLLIILSSSQIKHDLASKLLSLCCKRIGLDFQRCIYRVKDALEKPHYCLENRENINIQER